MEFSDKVALITGAARGIGKEIATLLAAGGARIAVVDVDGRAAKETANELGTARAFVCDVSSYQAAEQLRESVESAFGRVDYLVNNAGITRDRLLMRMSSEDWNQVLAVNLTGTFNISKAFSAQMLKRREGSIVNIASVVGLMGNAGQANYAASKAGVVGLTKALAKEFAGRGVRVNAVAPGFIRTVMTDGLSDEVRRKLMETIPLGRFGEARDVANIVVFLLSDKAGYVTGQVISCDGGMIMAR